MQPAPVSYTHRFTSLQKLVIFVFIALYLVACFSPLRLEYDSIRYFVIKDYSEAWCGVGITKPVDFLPYGYPQMLAILSKNGLLNAFSIAFINGLFLFGSVLLTRKIMGITNPTLFYVVVFLNWTCIKLFAYALSEMQYLFFSTLSLYCFQQFFKNKDWRLLLYSFLSCGLAIYTRTVGIALLAALVTGIAWEYRKAVSKVYYVAVIVILVALAALAVWDLPGLWHYVNALFVRSPNDPQIFDLLIGHFKEWGQLLLNIPIGKAQSYIAAICFLFAGLLLMAWLIYAILRSWKSIPAVIIIYLFIYTLVLFKWPHIDPRFWVPVLPFIAAIIIKAPLPAWKKYRIIAPAVFSAYVLLGVVAFGYSYYTQFNKKAFARNQANGIFRNEYETHFFGKPLSDSTAETKPYVLKILQKYDR